MRTSLPLSARSSPRGRRRPSDPVLANLPSTIIRSSKLRILVVAVAATVFVYLLVSDDRGPTVLRSEKYGAEDRPRSPVEVRRRRQVRERAEPTAGQAISGRARAPARVQLLDPDPVPRPPPRGAKYDPEARYLAYFMHSGYHNQVRRRPCVVLADAPQRISLENALVLARLLNRTLLMPPVYLGTAIPYIEFDKLYARVNAANKLGLDHCANLPSGSSFPRECIGFNAWTTVGWDFLVDLSSVGGLDVIDRWNGTYRWLEDNLGLAADEIHAIKDARMYQYRIEDWDAPLDKWEKKMPIESLRALSHHRLLHFGTLFGTVRLRLKGAEARAVRAEVRRSMVFRNPVLDAATDAVRDRLGGYAGYNSIHMRIGDGVFAENARANGLGIFRSLCTEQLGMDAELVDQLITESDARNGYQPVPPATLEPDEFLIGLRAQAAWRAQADPTSPRPRVKYTAYDHDPLPALARIDSRRASPLHPSLRCRGPLHTEPERLPLNSPLFIATDARLPMAEPALRIFFDMLPCSFVLGDFLSAEPTAVNGQPIEEIKQLEGVRNAQDRVPLSQFLMPVLDMMIAAKGRAAIGTPASTFSRFAVDVLYQTYHGWPIRERG